MLKNHSLLLLTLICLPLVYGCAHEIRYIKFEKYVFPHFVFDAPQKEKWKVSSGGGTSFSTSQSNGEIQIITTLNKNKFLTKDDLVDRINQSHQRQYIKSSYPDIKKANLIHENYTPIKEKYDALCIGFEKVFDDRQNIDQTGNTFFIMVHGMACVPSIQKHLLIELSYSQSTDKENLDQSLFEDYLEVSRSFKINTAIEESHLEKSY